MQAADAEAPELGRPQPLGLLLGRPRLDRLGLGDERADDVGLPPVLEVPAEAGVGRAAALVAHPARDHGLAVRGGLRDLGHVEVAEDGLRERARDRRRRHVQHVRRRPPERAPLLDPETVLLVDDGDGEGAELDLLLDERVRADGDVGLAAREPLADGAALRGRDRAREQLAADPQLVADALDGEKVLLGEGFRGRHQRALVPAFDRAQERVERDDGLPRADVALEEPLHRPVLAEVAADLGDGVLLVGGEGEREDGAVAGDQLALAGEGGRARVLRQRPPALLEAELEREQLLEGEAPPGGLGLVAVGRAVRRDEGVGAERQALLLAQA